MAAEVEEVVGSTDRAFQLLDPGIRDETFEVVHRGDDLMGIHRSRTNDVGRQSRSIDFAVGCQRE